MATNMGWGAGGDMDAASDKSDSSAGVVSGDLVAGKIRFNDYAFHSLFVAAVVIAYIVWKG